VAVLADLSEETICLELFAPLGQACPAQAPGFSVEKADPRNGEATPVILAIVLRRREDCFFSPRLGTIKGYKRDGLYRIRHSKMYEK